MIEISTMSNGVHVITDYHDNAQASIVSLWLHNGSRHQLPDQNGYAHFLEHLLFKGTQSHTAKQLNDIFETMGGQINAQTGREITGFYGTVPNGDARELLSLLQDMLLEPSFNEHDVEIEKNIVLQEMAMVKDDPEEVLTETATANVWPNHPIGLPILGDTKQITNATTQDLHGYLDSVRCGNRLWIICVGGTPHDKVLEACKALETLSAGEAPHSASPIFTQKNTSLEYGLSQSCLQWDMPALAPDHDDYPTLVVANHLLGGGTNSRLFQKVREELGLVYGIQSHLEIYSDAGLWSITTACEPENKQACFDAAEQCCEDLLSQGATQHELDITRRYIKASIILENHNLEARMERLAREAIYLKRIDTIEERLAKIDNVTQEDISSILKSAWSIRAIGQLSPES